MIINNFESKDVDAVAHSHRKTLISPSAKIGEAYLRKIYILLLSEPTTHLCLVAQEKGRILGSITATKDLEKTNKLLSKLISFSTLWDILKAIILKRITIMELIKRFMFEKAVLKRYPKPYVSILTLFVDEKYQRRGIGRRLTEATLNKLKKIGVKKVYVDTLLNNNKALQFYKSIGFIEKEALIDSRILEKKL